MLRRLLLRKLLPLPLEPYLSGLHIHLSSLWASCLLLEVVHAAVGTLVQRCELGALTMGSSPSMWKHM